MKRAKAGLIFFSLVLSISLLEAMHKRPAQEMAAESSQKAKKEQEALREQLLPRNQLRQLIIAEGATDQEKLHNAVSNIYFFMRANYPGFFDDVPMNLFLIEELSKLYTHGNKIEAAVALATKGAGRWLEDQSPNDQTIETQITAALKRAVESRDENAVQFLVGYGYKFMYPYHFEDFPPQYVPLIDRSYEYPPDEWESLLDISGRKTLLMVAAARGYSTIVKLLLEHGADPHLDLVELAGRPSAKDALMYAVRRGDIETVKLLLDADVHADKIYPHGFTALHIAAEQGHAFIVKMLLHAGALVNIKAEGGETPLMLAAENGYPEIVKMLLERRANPNIADKEGFTPLIVAADAENKNRLGFYPEVILLLLKAGAQINAQEEDGWTPLMMAAFAGNYQIVSLLLQAGALVNVRNTNVGRTALGMVRMLPDKPDDWKKEIIELLQKYGAQE